MKKGLVCILAAMCVMSLVITGCGQTVETEGEETKAVVEELKEQTVESADTESKEEASEEVIEESSEEATEESLEEVIGESSEEATGESLEEVIEESSEEVTEESTEEVAEESTEEAAEIDTTDLAKAYEGYLDKEGIIAKNVKCTVKTAAGGADVEMIVAFVDNDFQIGYYFPTASLDMYSENKKVYCRYELEGQENWIWAPIVSDEDEEFLLGMSGADILSIDDIHSYAYSETVEEDGVVYDVIAAQMHDYEGMFYVNRETQMVDRMITFDSESKMVCDIEEVDSIEVPEEAEKAQKGTVDDVVGCLFAVIISGSGMDVE